MSFVPRRIHKLLERTGRAVSRPSILDVRAALVAGDPIDDADFDSVFSPAVRAASRETWTPVVVARRAAQLLAPEPGAQILDLGAGPGKLCCVGALVATSARWTGVEVDIDLVAASTATSIGLDVADRVTFLHADMMDLDWGNFDALYFFNPFESAGLEGAPRRARTFSDEIGLTEQRLAEQPIGTRVVTYFGFGGTVPSSYSLISLEAAGSNHLALYVKLPSRRRCKGRSE